MNSKRKADLQRRLSMVSVPKPPADLADRIKQDIPRYLGTQNERERLSKAVTFNMRVAASIIILVSSAYLSIRFFSSASLNRSDAPVASVARMEAKKTDVLSNATPPPFRQPVIAPNTPPAERQPVSNEVAPPRSTAERIVMHRDVEEVATGVAASASTPAAVPAPAPAPPPPPIALAESAPAAAPQAGGADYYDATAKKAEPNTASNIATESSSANFTRQAQGRMNDAKTFTAPITADLVRSANAASLDLGARDAVFGFSVGSSAFENVKTAIEHGEHPSNVDVEGLVNYFAGAAKRTPRDVRLEAEGSPAPVDEGPRTVLVRYTIDTPRDVLPPHASVPPIATDAKIDIDFDSRAVASFRRVGGDARTDANEPSLLKNTSVTVVYAVQLQPQVTNWMRVATIRLHYTNVTNGRDRTLTKVLNVRDVTQPWTSASRRHRLASLGAVWGEQLKSQGKSTTGGADVARRAQELSKQEPKDERAKELAALANAASR